MTTQPRYPALTLALLATAQFIIAVDYNIVYLGEVQSCVTHARGEDNAG
ncbi:hypothetical protein [Caballeronia sordidicola]|uniref:Uncharacterized protein n=1 Tax=Caballeronia sordidicola TaxID=196367 RepID=A0A226WQH1_CABSO|nr:hypothetical protein [Caballeronia sordidicola]OXC73436.1 hypothetical protein BSU04_37015 [Caballeronia sordidicola]